MTCQCSFASFLLQEEHRRADTPCQTAYNRCCAPRLKEEEYMNTPGPMPLEGVRVLDIATLFAGPMIAMFLGDFGADVIKVEHPKGDPLRSFGAMKDGVPLCWKMVARNKRTVTLNFSQGEGQ